MVRVVAQLVTGDWLDIASAADEQTGQNIAASWEAHLVADSPDMFVSVGGPLNGQPNWGQAWDRFRLSSIVRIQVVVDD